MKSKYIEYLIVFLLVTGTSLFFVNDIEFKTSESLQAPVSFSQERVSSYSLADLESFLDSDQKLSTRDLQLIIARQMNLSEKEKEKLDEIGKACNETTKIMREERGKRIEAERELKEQQQKEKNRKNIVILLTALFTIFILMLRFNDIKKVSDMTRIEKLILFLEGAWAFLNVLLTSWI